MSQAVNYPDLTPLLGDSLDDIRGRLIPNQLLSAVTWFRVGGPAQLMFQPADEADLAVFLKALPDDVPVTVVGLGSNLLVRDGGIEGVVIRLPIRGFGQVEYLGGHKLLAGACVPDKKLAEEAAKSGTGGFAFYTGIPGAVGGALRMNAGAHGSETKDLVVNVNAVTRSGEIVTLSNEEMGYAYRHSFASKDLIFTSAVFAGRAQKEDEIRAEMAEVGAHREKAQPIREKTGGSTFKNPEGSSAWRTVDAAGCRGLQVGGAKMSELHCNFMLNVSDATAHDLEWLGEQVRSEALEKTGTRLEWEIKRLGKFVQGAEIQPFLGKVV
ncbi:UDP-N-acetylenolpyruvoylglucosamine reductase [Pseudovibrio axinellae]|uniref:UDP-N-acetylenolpyruvoylglucosamine reductase n=1 Tax=Pseudovibrio axinellae TaxID=989403 RepID=A0A166AS31_9HYPH|nr:UDP-N-acetylmuramate dehydrogenase [Pseudovibrio axinellae]KZL21485.1 UDP-N-acetylenolpyruvoylglucosamine reductase [Pseudovibrio axinellae]SER06830.1 UDP-N-acetylmuramate dehydrogenase [Pseudovibrio axinellae]